MKSCIQRKSEVKSKIMKVVSISNVFVGASVHEDGSPKFRMREGVRLKNFGAINIICNAKGISFDMNGRVI